MDTKVMDTSKLKNVTVRRTQTRNDDETWMAIHEDGWRDVCFNYFAKELLSKKEATPNTREQHARIVALFLDYLAEAVSSGTLSPENADRSGDGKR
jgi:hypothetical protein